MRKAVDVVRIVVVMRRVQGSFVMVVEDVVDCVMKMLYDGCWYGERKMVIECW